ncbi:MAG: carbohydrate ABC transporter permease [Bacilli bacterium]|nr:carbohydrate ABC transporter permease [Bacilli bacterium]
MFTKLKYAIAKFFRNKHEANAQSEYERKHDTLYKRHGVEKAVFIVVFIIFAIFAASFIFPFLWILMNAFKTKADFARDAMCWPQNFTFDSFIKAFTFSNRATSNFNIFQMMGMSVIVAGFGTLVTVFTSSCAAYVVAKYKFPGRSVIFGVVIFSIIVPIVGALPSQIQLMKAMGLNDKVIGCIFLYSGGFGTNFLLLYSFFKNLSWTYVEAAKIDGASDFRIFGQVILPMAKGPITAVTILTLIGLWNDYITPSIYLSKQPTIAVGIYYMQQTMLATRADYPMFFATIILTLLPIILVFVLFSKTIMENTSVGGLKG